MTQIRYLPAAGADGWRVAVAGPVLAALPPAVTAQTADAVWRRLADGGIGALLEALTGAFGTSLTAIPPFALVVVEDDGVRIAVRGTLEVVVETADGAVAVSSGGTATWAERLVPRAQRVTIELSGGFDPVDALPLTAGVAPAAAVVLTVATAAAAPAPNPAAVDSAPAPETPARDAAVPDAPATRAPAEPPAAAADTEHATSAVDSRVSPAGDVPAALELAPEAVLETVMTDRTRAKAGREPLGVEPEGSETWVPATTEHPAGAGSDLASASLPASSSASVVATGASDENPPTDWFVQGDHDGATISVAEARALRGAQPAFDSTEDVPARRPAQGRIRLSTGRVVELERPVVIGRRPRSVRTSGSDLPTLVAVESPEHDISRNHVEIRAEGEHVLVTDLDTTNGTVLLRGGADPVRLHPGEPTMVVTGDVLDIGDGVTVAFEDLP